MSKWIAIALLVVIAASCSNKKSAAPVATPVPPNCRFILHLPSLAAYKSGTFGTAQLEQVVNEAPSDVRNDLRLAYGPGIRFWADIRSAASLPKPQRKARVDAAAAALKSSSYLAGVNRVKAYVGDHCPGTPTGGGP